MQWITLGLAILLSAAFSIAHAEKNAFNVTCLDGITLPQGTLQTTGQGSVTAQPDQGKVFVRVEVTRNDATTARQDAAVVTNATLAAIAPLVPAEDISTTDISLTPNFVYEPDTMRQSIQGYTFSQTIILKIVNLSESSTLGATVDAVVEAGGNDVRVDSVSIELSPATQQQAMDAARGLAVTRALTTANIIAEAAGLVAGPVTSITDSNYSPGIPVPYTAMAEPGAADASRMPTPVVIGQQTIESTLTLEVALCPGNSTL